MDHKRLYDNLILYRKSNRPDGYCENHHIIPKSLGGPDDSDNLVRLTGREHWIAHLLLHKIHKLPETAHACHMMAMRCEERGIPRIKTSHQYQTIRKEVAKLASARAKKLVGARNGSYGTMWISNVELKLNKKIPKSDELPTGWVAGRNKWSTRNSVITKSCKGCGDDFSTEQHRRQYCSSVCRPTTKGYKRSAETKKLMSDIKKELYKDPTKNPAYGRIFKHTEESKKKMSKARTCR